MATPARPARTPVRRAGRFRAVWVTGQFAALLGALICGGAIAYLLTAGRLTVQEVALAGASATRPEDVAAAGGVMGHNIFTVDPQVVAERLIALPTVRDAQVWSELPGRLVVRLVERQPALVWQLGNDRFLLDVAGVVIALNPATETTQSLPRITARDLPAPQVGAHLDPAQFSAALTIARRAPEYGLPVAGIEYAPADGFSLSIGGGQGTAAKRIILGGDARLAEKLAASGAILKNDQNWTILNVTDPDRPFFPVR